METADKPHAEAPCHCVSPCGAQTRRGAPCKQPAMKNGRCRLHGGKSTGPRTPEGLARCGNWKHGLYSQKAKTQRVEIRALIKQARELAETV